MDLIKKKLEEIIRRVFGIFVTVEVTLAPEEFKADFATNVAMKITGEVNKTSEKKMSPREIAEVLKQEFLKSQGDKLPGFEVEIAGAGFLNFTPRDEFYFNFIESLGENLENFEKNISLDEYKGKMVVTEFSDPNPFKVLHVGHLYTSIVGDAISRLIETAGGKVVRTNFGGDVGLHVAKTIYAILGGACGNISSRDRTFRRPVVTGDGRPVLVGLRPRRVPRGGTAVASEDSLKETVASAPTFTIDDIAKAYVEGTRMYEKDSEAKKEITRLNKIIYKIAELGEGNCGDLNDEEKKIAEIYWRGRELSYKYFKDFYKKIGVKFDKFYPESTVASVGLNKILEQKEQGIYSESEGAIVFKGEDFGLHTRVFINKEGLPTYEAKDVGLLFTKWADYKFDESVVITGNDIIDYMKVVLKSVEQYAPELVQRTTHITHGNVRLPGNEKMSSRKGNFVTAVSVLALVKSTLVASSASADTDKIVLAAIKYFFLKYKIGGNIVFDAEESVSLNGNSGPYLLYSVVRAKKILDKVNEQKNNQTSVFGTVSSCRPSLRGQASLQPRQQPAAVSSNGRFGYSLSLAERSLNKKFVQYPEVLRGAVREKAPHLIANYLFELSQEFSRFYENCQVAGDERETERKRFVQVFAKIMEHGLNILGIDVPDEM